jgi:hypothetical protein
MAAELEYHSKSNQLVCKSTVGTFEGFEKNVLKKNSDLRLQIELEIGYTTTRN